MRIVDSLVRAIGEEAEMAGVPLKTGIASAKKSTIPLDVVVIPKCLGRGECISSDLAKHASLNSFLNFKHLANF